MKRTKLVKKAIPVSLALFLLSGCAKGSITNLNAQGSAIICFGDSLTFGYGAEPGQDFPAFLQPMIAMRVINAGIDGDTTTEALRRIEADVLQRDPLLVIIEFGGNDFLRKVPKEETLDNIRIMIDKIHAHGAMVALVDISAGILLKEYRSAFLDIAREKKVLFIPAILKGIITNPSLKSDFLHPNADGYRLIAYRIYNSIKPVLEENQRLRGQQGGDVGAEGGS